MKIYLIIVAQAKKQLVSDLMRNEFTGMCVYMLDIK